MFKMFIWVFQLLCFSTPYELHEQLGVFGCIGFFPLWLLINEMAHKGAVMLIYPVILQTDSTYSQTPFHPRFIYLLKFDHTSAGLRGHEGQRLWTQW